MPGATASGFPYGLLTDAADIQTAVKPLADYLELLMKQLVPIGSVMAWAGQDDPVAGTPPIGIWMIANGRSLSRTTYADLFTALGGVSSPYGFADGSTFRLPNTETRVVMGEGSSSVTGIEYDEGDVGGVEQVALSSGQLPAHTHGMSHSHRALAAEALIGTGPGSGLMPVRGSTLNAYRYNGAVEFGDIQSDDGINHNFVEDFIGNTVAAGLNQGHENNMRYLVMNYIIRVK